MWSFYPLVWRAVLLGFRSFPEGNNSYLAVDLPCPLDEVSSGSSFAASLDTLPPRVRVTHFLIGLFDFLLLSFKSFWYILDERFCLSHVSLVNIFSQSLACLVILLILSCTEQKSKF